MAEKKPKKKTENNEKKEHKKNWREEQATPEEIRQFLTANVLFRYNVVTGRTEFRVPEMDPYSTLAQMYYPNGTRPLQEWQSATQWHEMNDRFFCTLFMVMNSWKDTRKDFLSSTLESDFVEVYDPFKFYLDRLPPWDGMTDAILELSETVKVKGESDDDDNEQLLFYLWLKKWLVGVVASWLEDKKVNEEILVFVGPQGIGKSNWFEALLPPELKDYFQSNTGLGRLNQKDEILKLSQYGLICCEEIDVLKSQDLNNLKWAVTAKVTDERRAYARFSERRKHIASYCGTGNYTQFLTDETGNRRWLPFEVERFERTADHEFDHAAIFAQAYALYKEGFQYWFDPVGPEAESLRKHNRRFRVVSYEEQMISRYYRPLLPGEKGRLLSSGEMLAKIAPQLPVKSEYTPNKLSKLLLNMGFTPGKSNAKRGFKVYAYSSLELQLQDKEEVEGDAPAATSAPSGSESETGHGDRNP